MNVVVVGGGKMGLPLACQFAHSGASVTVCDINAAAVSAINRGDCPIDEPGVSELLAQTVAGGRLRASVDTAAAAAQADVIVIIVPVLLTPGNDADLSIIEAVSQQIATSLKPGALVSYETTLPIGTTRRFASLLEAGGLKAGQDFHVVFSPERVKSQFVLKHLTRNAKVVGGITPAAAEKGAAFYERYLGAPVINVGTLEAAEMVKLAGMIYRDVNIALANELARYAEVSGIDFNSIIAAINTDGEAAVLQPGIGVGGHCAPVYPYFAIRDSQRRGLQLAMTQLARDVNDGQANWYGSRLEKEWQPVKNQDVLILGLGFRPQVKEHVCSSSFLVGADLRRRGANVFLNDPLYTDQEIRHHGFNPFSLASATLPPAMILSTAHGAYRDLSLHDLSSRGVRAIVDGRSFWRPTDVRAAGILYIGAGCP